MGDGVNEQLGFVWTSLADGLLNILLNWIFLRNVIMFPSLKILHFSNMKISSLCPHYYQLLAAKLQKQSLHILRPMATQNQSFFDWTAVTVQCSWRKGTLKCDLAGLPLQTSNQFWSKSVNAWIERQDGFDTGDTGNRRGALKHILSLDSSSKQCPGSVICKLSGVRNAKMMVQKECTPFTAPGWQIMSSSEPYAPKRQKSCHLLLCILNTLYCILQ